MNVIEKLTRIHISLGLSENYFAVKFHILFEKWLKFECKFFFTQHVLYLFPDASLFTAISTRLTVLR